MRPHAVSCPPTTDHQEQLPCPRCDSTNTKFCYYNNYNFSQPRHFCKSCRRYWTHGGTLRDIPIGGGSRKPAKRSRTSSSSTRTPPSSLSNGTTPLDTDAKGSALSLCGTFTSLLNANANATPTHGSASVIGLGGIGLGSAFDDLSFGLGRPVWPFSTLPDATTTNAGPIPATWQFEGLESNAGGFVSAEYFAWPDLSITTPGNSLK